LWLSELATSDTAPSCFSTSVTSPRQSGSSSETLRSAGRKTSRSISRSASGICAKRLYAARARARIALPRGHSNPYIA
jgi:hypothetical protein